jgi:hypothetical protein
MFAIWYLPQFGNLFIQSLLQNVLVLKAHYFFKKKISMKMLKLDFINAKSYIIGLQKCTCTNFILQKSETFLCQSLGNHRKTFPQQRRENRRQ